MSRSERGRSIDKEANRGDEVDENLVMSASPNEDSIMGACQIAQICLMDVLQWYLYFVRINIFNGREMPILFKVVANHERWNT